MNLTKRNNPTLNKTSIYFLVFFVSIIFYISYLLINSYELNKSIYDTEIFMMSWVGIVVFVFIIWSWNQITRTYFSLYTIFILFFILFNYGQPLMWAVGIHLPNEIGKANLYTLGQAMPGSILYTQILTLVSILMFHLGAIICYKPRIIEIKDKCNEDINTLKILYYVCLTISLIAIPVTIYTSFTDLLISKSYGYKALYYGDVKSGSSLLGIIRFLFFPCLVGLLIGSKYNRKVMLGVYAIFFVYMIINLLAGDRGNWVYYLVILIFMSHTFYKRISLYKTVFYGTLSFLSLYLINAIVSLRNTGISFENLKSALSTENSPLISVIFEMGGSMKPALVLVQYGWDVWPYGNSYINSIIGVISSKIFEVLNIPFSTLSSWFSQEYLGLTYGAAFSIIAEPLVNFGPTITPVFMIVLGFIIASLTYLHNDVSYTKYPLRVFFAITSMSAFVTLIRNHSHFVIKEWFFGCLLICVLVLLFRSLLKRNAY